MKTRQIGQCIYCFRQPPIVTLEKEHIIPSGIGGDFTLLDASCRDCAELTSQDEGACQHGPLRILRAATGHPRPNKSNRKRGKVPATEFDVQFEKDGIKFIHRVDLENIPYLGFFPLFPRPQILSQLSLSTKPIDFMWASTERELTPDMGLPPHDRIIDVGEFPLDAWYRMLAKIGHGYAVYCLGLDAFTPLLPLYIRRKHLNPWKYVGLSIRHLEKDDAPHILAVRFQETNIGTVVIVLIRLFARVPVPTYEVVAGVLRVKKESIDLTSC